MKQLNNVMLLAYASNSKGATRLAETLGIKKIRRDSNDSSFNSQDNEVVINWGNSTENLPDHCRDIVNWINPPECVDVTIDKAICFEQLKEAGVPTPEFFFDANSAADHLIKGGHGVVIRDTVHGMQGNGISYAYDVLSLKRAPLYTGFFKHEAEVRVHVVNGKVVELHDKTGAGFKGTHTGNAYNLDKEARTMLSSIAQQAIKAVGLDMGAVDLLWNDEFDDAVVLEINTAPTMVNGTLTAYDEAIRAWLGEEPKRIEAPKEPKASSADPKASEGSPKASDSPKASEKSDQERAEAIIDGQKEPKASPKASEEPKASTTQKDEPKASTSKEDDAKASKDEPKASESVTEPLVETTGEDITQEQAVEELLGKAQALIDEAMTYIASARSLLK